MSMFIDIRVCIITMGHGHMLTQCEYRWGRCISYYVSFSDKILSHAERSAAAAFTAITLANDSTLCYQPLFRSLLGGVHTGLSVVTECICHEYA